MSTRKNQTGNEGAVSAKRFALLRGRVKKLEDWKKRIEAADELATPEEEVPETVPVSGGLDRFRGFVKRNPLFWTAACMMAGFFLGCVICDFSMFGGY